MISEIRLQNYKSFIDQKLEIAPLTILTGLNGSGKSSVIKAVKIIKESYLQGFTAGDFDKTYNIQALKSKLTKDDSFSVSMLIDGIPYRREVTRISESGWNSSVDDIKNPKRIDTAFIHYLSADRYGPRNTLPRGNIDMLDFVGDFGEYAISYLEKNQYYTVPEKLRLNTDSENLQDVVNDWLNVITPGTKVEYSFNPTTQEYSITYSGITPVETGFGLSAALPVLLSLLCFKAGAILLIENPEVHLHPAAQSQFGKLLAQSASLGNQIIVETHSDHIIDGIRIAVLEHKIACADVKIHFLRRDDFEKPTEVISPILDENGKLSEWPDGFFDQALKDKAVLTRYNNG